MKGIHEKDFEYYENQAAYFAYIHDPDDYDCWISDKYFELDQKVIKAVEKLGTQDWIERKPERSVEQLAEFVVSEKLLPKEKVDPVKYELHMHWLMSMMMPKQNRTSKTRSGVGYNPCRFLTTS